MAFSDAGTKAGHLSPWETCKAFALHTALQTIEATLQTRACDLLGERTNAWIGKHLRVKGGGCPTEGAVVKAIERCQEKGWYPGKAESKSGGRPPVYTTRQKRKLAEAAMTLKRNIVRPTPARVRAQVPRTCVHPESGEPASDYTVYSISKTMCHDDFEDDPWRYLNTVTKDYLPEAMKPKRVKWPSVRWTTPPGQRAPAMLQSTRAQASSF